MACQDWALVLLSLSVGCGNAVDVASGDDGSGSSGQETSSSSSGGTSDGGSVGSSDGSTTDLSTSGPATGSTPGSSTGPAQAEYCIETTTPAASVGPDALADVDGDGVPEVWSLPSPLSPNAPVRAHRVSGTELDANVFEFEVPGDGFAFADIDGDGRDDLIRSHEGTTVYHPGQADLSVAEQGSPMPAFDIPLGTSFVDIDHDGDDDAVTFSADDPDVLEVWRNDAGTFTLHGSAAADIQRGVSLDATAIAGSTWLAVRTDPGSSDGVFSLLDVVDGGVNVLHQSQGTPQTVYGSYVDDEGPAILANEDGVTARLRWNGDTLESVPLLSDTRGATVGTYDGIPMLIGAENGELVLLDLTTDERFSPSVSPQSTAGAPWQGSGIGADGQLFFLDCNLAGCTLEIGVLSPC